MIRSQTNFRWISYGAVAIAVAVALVAVFIWAKKSSHVNRRAYEKIQIGMSIAEVEAILGPPYDDVVPLNHEDLDFDETLLRHVAIEKALWWKDDTHMISVTLSFQGRAVTKSYTRDPDVGIVRRFIDWLGL